MYKQLTNINVVGIVAGHRRRQRQSSGSCKGFAAEVVKTLPQARTKTTFRSRTTATALSAVTMKTSTGNRSPDTVMRNHGAQGL